MGSLTSAQKSVIIGSILGDGALRIQAGRRNALLEINHSIKAELYLRWKYKILQQLVLMPPKIRKTNGGRFACRFTTRSLPVLTDFYSRFYRNGKKRIPLDLSIDELSLAVWFMDDGSKTRSSYYLNTQQFERNDQLILVKILYCDYGISATLNRDKDYYRIRIRTSSTGRLNEIIQPLILPWLRYKLTNDPVTTDPKGEVLLIQTLIRGQYADSHHKKIKAMV